MGKNKTDFESWLKDNLKEYTMSNLLSFHNPLLRKKYYRKYKLWLKESHK